MAHHMLIIPHAVRAITGTDPRWGLRDTTYYAITAMDLEWLESAPSAAYARQIAYIQWPDLGDTTICYLPFSRHEVAHKSPPHHAAIVRYIGRGMVEDARRHIAEAGIDGEALATLLSSYVLIVKPDYMR